jgi:hypothetical protein
MRRQLRPLLTVETEANGELWSTNEGVPSLVGSLVRRADSRFFFILPWLLWSTQYTKYFFPHRKFFHFVPIAQEPWYIGRRAGSPISVCPHHPATWAGSRAGWPVSECVSREMCLWSLTLPGPISPPPLPKSVS